MATKSAVKTQTMKAVRIHRFGGPERLKYEEVPRPEPGPGEVLIRVHASGVNPVDWKIREGAFKSRLPLTLGWDFSGIVEEAGPGARFKPGDEVYGRPDTSRDGSYAEYLVARATEIASKPRTIDHLHAAGIALAGLTAWQALFDAAGLQPGQTVLIHGASGGVGGFAVQLAKWRGARVIGTASKRNFDFVRGLGADEILDHEAKDFLRGVSGVDVVLDTIGGETQTRSWKTLKYGGTLVSIVQPPSRDQAEARGAKGILVSAKPSADQLAELARLVDAGKIKVAVETVLPLSEARRAQELSQSHHARGKIVLRVV